MAIYHLSVKPLSRAGGRSATAASAYRSAERIEDRTTGEVFDYTRKSGVEHTEIVLSSAATKQDIHWPRDRTALWNAAEVAERRSDARVAREYEVALPHELNRAQRLELVRTFSTEIANRYSVAVDFAIHRPHRAGDERNHHAHILTTTRKIETTGLGAKADIELADTDRAKKGLVPARQEITAIRERWATLSNEYLKTHGHESRVDHRTLEAQGIEREPTVHRGPAVEGLARRGERSNVLERIAEQQKEEMQQRLERAAELGRLARESADVDRAILTLSTDIHAALAERERAQRPDRSLSRGAAPEADRGRTPDAPRSAEDVRRAAREQWLQYRGESGKAERETSERGIERDTGRSDERDPGPAKGRDGPDDDYSL